MKIGTGREEITPKIGIDLAGYTEARKSTGIHDPLFAKALVLEEDNIRVAIIGCDVIVLAGETVRKARELIKEKAEIPEENIIIHSTHTHTGPATAGIFGTEEDKDYISILPEKIAHAVTLAQSETVPVEIEYGRSEETRISFNRRYLMKNGEIWTNPGYGNPDIVRTTGPIDPEIEVMRFKDQKGETKAFLVNFACHCDTVGGDLFSADYPGVLEKAIQKGVGDNIFVLFLNGCSGNINHFNFLYPETMREKYFAHTQWMGEILGEDVLRICRDLKKFPEPELRISRKKLQIPRRFPSPLQLRIAEKIVKEGKDTLTQQEGEEWSRWECFGPEREETWAREMILVNQEPSVIETEVQVVRIGEIALVGLPGEVFVEHGLRIKESGFFQTFVAQLCNGAVGYIPTKEAFDQPTGYEQRLARSSKLIPEAGEILTRTAVNLLSELRG